MENGTDHRGERARAELRALAEEMNRSRLPPPRLRPFRRLVPLGIVTALYPGRFLYRRAWHQLANLGLHTLAADDDLPGIHWLLRLGAELEGSDGIAGATPLMWAAHFGALEGARELLNQGADPNARDKFGQTALHGAAEDGRDEIVRLLLERGADPNAAWELGWTPAIMAAQRGHVEVLRLLAAHGADLQARDRHGKDVLAWAEIWGQEECAVWLRQTH